MSYLQVCEDVDVEATILTKEGQTPVKTDYKVSMVVSSEEVVAVGPSAVVVKMQVPPTPAKRTKFLKQHTVKVPPIPAESVGGIY